MALKNKWKYFKEVSMIFKFVNWDVPELKELKGSKAYKVYEKLNKGIKLSREEKDWVFEKLQTNSYSKTGIPLMGWMFDLSEFLKEYWVELEYYDYGIVKVYSLDKTSIRNYYGSYNVLKIVDIKNAKVA